LTSALVEGEWSTSRPGRFTPGERAPGTHWIGGWVGLRAGLNDLEKRKFLTPPGLELRPLGRPARSNCPGCDEAYEEPITEDGVQCSGSQQWSHEDYSSYEGFGLFKYEVC
jgi:hypothetical protein